MYPFRTKDSYGRQEFFNLPLVADNLLKKDQSRKIKFIDQMNGIQVTYFHNRSTEPLNYRIYARPQSVKQARRPEFYKYTRLPVIKLSLNFELLEEDF